MPTQVEIYLGEEEVDARILPGPGMVDFGKAPVAVAVPSHENLHLVAATSKVHVT